ncbi:fatty acid desaturase [Paenibacillus roseipurpureus]|uniref:Fatty acid desaturase n=1 Tax=Paenibacillus roseopurpureus TaxID=2918901 RepID=A0AA96LPF8_9BACL|nr:fatty acid desaturase [Paenibacillus sp. MBLB1832]WNR44892.1 fatty acid desaturase [Paenibacillus sp. MBLB1832]
MSEMKQRDYSIWGPERHKAIEKGLVSAEWYQCPVPRKRMKELMARKDGPALRDILLWIGLLVVSGYVAFLTWGTWLAIPAFAAYGMIYSISAVSRWHEYSHGTPFRTAWVNEVIYQICSFLILEQATNFRWTHTRHHTDTIIVGSDPEIMEPRPPKFRRILRVFLRVTGFHLQVHTLLRQSIGILNAVELELIPESQHRKLFWEARLFVLIYGGLIALCFYLGTVLPLLYVGLPAFYGFFANTLLVLTQHMGLYEDMTDHRICARTFYTNPFLRFLYSNMNYHMEHHMFPMVPYYNLPALHAEIKHDCPAAAPSLPSAVRETVAALRRQKKDPTYVVPRYREFAEKNARKQASVPITVGQGGANYDAV